MWRVCIVTWRVGLRSALAQTIQDQAHGMLSVIGAVSWEPAALATIGALRPDVVVLALGFEAASQLRFVPEIRRQAPGCRVLAIDTLSYVGLWGASSRGEVDALVCAEDLATELVPAILHLAGQRDGPPSPAPAPASMAEKSL